MGNKLLQKALEFQSRRKNTRLDMPVTKDEVEMFVAAADYQKKK